MKKWIALILVGLLVCALAACGQKTEEEPSEEKTAVLETAAEQTDDTVTAGGWTAAQSPVLTEDEKAVFDKAAEGLTGVGYTPVAYVASQVVAGTNHLFLCKAEPITEEAAAVYALVTVYEDPEGSAEITDIAKSTVSAPVEALDGGWAETGSPALTDEVKAAFTKAAEGFSGVGYEPVAQLATQVVAGTNYSVLCRATPVADGTDAYYAIVTVYEDLEGNAEITDISKFGADSDTDAQ